MNVYLFELKAQAKNLIAQTIALAGLLAVLMLAVYPIYKESQVDVQAVLNGFPPEFAAAFGISVADMFSFAGFFSFGFLYLSLIGAIMAVTLGLSVFAREKQSKCTDFLLTKPRSRTDLFVKKFLACLTGLVGVNVVFLVTSVVIYLVSGDVSSSVERVLFAASALFFTQLVFLCAAIFLAVFLRKVRSVSGIATGIGFGGFILAALPTITGEELLRFISPLQYFEVETAFFTGSFEMKYVLMAAVVGLVLLGAAFARYNRADVHAV